MIDLGFLSGMPLALDDAWRLVVRKPEMPDVAPVPRTVAELKGVLAEPERAADGVAYLMYRGIAPRECADELAARNVRFDVTILLAGTLGDEYIKTAGHYHPDAASGVPYPEVYEVLHGRGAFLMQRTGKAGVEDAVVVYAGPGDKVNMLPGYGHVTVNVGDEPLVINNIVAADFESVYGEYASLHGAAYYVFRTPDGPAARPNPHYGNPPPLRVAPPYLDAALGLTREPLFTVWRRAPELFTWLGRPEQLARNLRP